MTETIQVTVEVSLIEKLDGEDPKVREIVQAVVDGTLHPNVENVELVDYKTEDFRKTFR